MDEEKKATCPVCGSVRITDEHLMDEYLEMMKASFGVFKRNAINAQREVAEILLARGITEIPNMFGAIPIKRYEVTEEVFYNGKFLLLSKEL